MSRDKLSVLVRLIREEERDILDIGCGTGSLVGHLSSLGKRTTGVEIAPDKTPTASHSCHDFLQGDIESAETLQRLRDLGRRYDLLIFSEVLEHLVQPEATLKNLTPLLREGGAVLLVLPNVAFYKTRLVHLSGRWPVHPEGIFDKTHLRFFTLETARALVQGCGFRITSLEATHYSTRFRFLYDRLTRWRPTLFGEQFVIRAEPA
jgi:2-polyprenyl-3-methyl-5-hydroxy-6-metoxy-1,4-benzoquinol methylase